MFSWLSILIHDCLLQSLMKIKKQIQKNNLNNSFTEFLLVSFMTLI